MTPRRILFVTKFRFLGDTLLAVPTFRAARQAWPDARIVLLTGYPARTLLEGCPYLDDIWAFDPHVRDAGMRAYFQLVRRIRAARFDAFLTLNRSFHSALTPTLAGISLRAGFRTEGRDFLLNRLTEYDPEKPEIDCFGDVLRLLAPDAKIDSAPELWVSRAEAESADERLRAAFGLPFARRNLLGLQPGASLPGKRWSAERWAGLAAWLVKEDPDLRVVFIGGVDERDAAQSVLTRLGPTFPAADFVGACSLRESLGLLSRLSLFIAGDTAMRHAAAALGVPTVALFGPTGAGKWATPGHATLQGVDGNTDAIRQSDVLEAVRPLFAHPLVEAAL